MKKALIIVFVIALASLSSFAQRFQGGILGGLNGTQVDGDSYKGYHKAGLVLGAYAQTDISRNLYASMEMKFAQKGSRNVDSTAAYGQIKYIMRLNYAEMPLYLGIRIGEKTSIITGATFGYLISGKEFNDNGEFPPEDQHPFNAFDLEAMLGFRFQITDRLFVDVRGEYSVIPIREKIEDADLYYWRDNQFNNVLNTTLLYRLDF
jgi:opacity protein-like surface antigen